LAVAKNLKERGSLKSAFPSLPSLHGMTLA
jgi:hypothetical protein